MSSTIDSAVTPDARRMPNLLSRLSRTKTVATVGPASSRREQLVELINNGVDIFRLNMAHGKRPDHEAAIDNIRWAAEQTAAPVGILVDLAGPKIRLGKLASDPLKLQQGHEVRFVRGIECRTAMNSFRSTNH